MMKRKLAVPIALKHVEDLDRNVMNKTRTLRASEDDPFEVQILLKLAENRTSIERLWKDIDTAECDVDCSEIVNELEYLKADLEASLVEIEAEIEDVPDADEILAQEAEAILA